MKQFKPISHLREQFSDESKKRISEQVAKMNADIIGEQSDSSITGQFMHSKHLPVADDIYQWLQKDGKNPSVQLNEILHKVMQGDLEV